MNRSYKFRIYPTDEQAHDLTRMLGISRAIYNRLLYHCSHEYELRGRAVRRDEAQRFMKQWRYAIGDGFLPADVANCTSVRRLDKAMKAFYRRCKNGDDPGYPKFKGRFFWNSLEATYNNAVRVKDCYLYISRVGNIYMRQHRPIPSDAKIKYVIVTKRRNKWFVVLQTDELDGVPQPTDKPMVGIDIGITHAFALSDGTVYDAPKPLKEATSKMRVLQRKLARRKRGSIRWLETKRQINKAHQHIANIRRDWWHKVTSEMVQRYGGFVFEDLNLAFMIRNHHLSRATIDVSIGMGREILEYKAARLGLPIKYVDAAYTSQACPDCGIIVKKRLDERWHSCECGCELDRDVAAAKVILQRGLSEGCNAPAGDNAAQ